MIVLPLLVLIPLTLFPAFFGHTNAIYALGTLFVGSIFLYHGSVLALQKSTDGFLWLGTAQGLYRFDGVSFERYEPFQSSNITALLAFVMETYGSPSATKA
jgi:ligand-binding sensor domain-containing protein